MRTGRGRRAAPTLSILLVLSVLTGACTPPGSESVDAVTPRGAQPFDLASYDLVDLTYAYDDDTVFWPTSPTHFELEELAYGVNDRGFFYAANQFCTPEHGGTHLDAPIHFAEGRHTVEAIPLERLIGPAVVIDIEDFTAEDRDHRLTLDDVRRHEAAHGEVQRGAIVLVRTGWGQFWGNPLAYLGDDTPGDASNLHFPSFGLEATRFLVEERAIRALGIDTASIDHGPSRDFPVHRLVAEANIPGFENVANLDLLPPTGAHVIALPMKIAGGSGGPVRIVAFVPRGD